MTRFPNLLLFSLCTLCTVAYSPLAATELNASEAPPNAHRASSFQGVNEHNTFLLPLNVTSESNSHSTLKHDQHIIMVDTSASQIGQHRQQGLEVVSQLLKSIPANHKVWVWAVDTKVTHLHDGFSAIDEELSKSIMQKLGRRFPAGTTSLKKALSESLSHASSVPTSIIYLGDGINSTDIFTSNELKDYTSQLFAKKMAFHSIAIGPMKDLEMLGVLSRQTGGVVIDDKPGLTATEITQEMVSSINTDLLYPERIEIKSNIDTLKLVSTGVIPLRTNHTNYFLAASSTKQQLPSEITISYKTGEFTTNVVINVEALQNSNAYLGAAYNRCIETDGLGFPIANKNVLSSYKSAFSQKISSLTSLGEKSLELHKTDEARNIAQLIKVMDPGNTQANAITNVANKLDKAKVEMVSFNQPVLPVEPLDDRTDAPTPKEKNPINKFQGLEQAATERLQIQVSRALEEAQKLANIDPDASLDILKVVKGTLQTAVGVNPDVVAQLDRKVGNTMIQINSQKQKFELEQIRSQERLAEIEARKRLSQAMVLEEERLEQLIDQVRALIEQGRHGDDIGYEKAESVAIAAVNLRPGNGPATAARFGAEAQVQLNKAFRLRELRADRFLATLQEVEKSHVPFPDEPPVRYPPAQVWRALTERREKWKSVDLKLEKPNEQRIRNALEEETEFEFIDTPLKNALENIAEIHNITIIIEEQKLLDEGITLDEPVNLVLSGITLRSGLKILLEKNTLTWIIEDEVMKITTQTEAEQKLETRVYPVGDLAVQLNSGGGGGGLGGQGQGGFGGQQGGQQGGFGGGQQGGGFFSIPTHPANLFLKKNQ